ncbi:MAG: DUF3541 domain-containing protein [Oscillatoria sp. SIO1A7]|nr:DUF3541 domain-containing protein [Oscillatoria sp. SIO1A7]
MGNLFLGIPKNAKSAATNATFNRALTKQPLMMSSLLAVLLTIVLFFASSPQAIAAPVPGWYSESEVATKIQERFESEFDRLPRAEQKHYALRLYRITGDESYLQPVIADILATAWFASEDLQRAAEPGYAQYRQGQVLQRSHPHSPRDFLRQDLMRRAGTIAFDRHLLYEVNKINEYGLLGTPGFENTDKALDYLRQVDWAAFMLDPEVIQGFSAKLINDIYYLVDLDIIDLREAYTRAFQGAFPPDDQLTAKEFEAKTYGLTHVILSDSRYFQKMVDPVEFSWVFEWFEKNSDRILRESKPDVLAEVALSYLLANQGDRQLVAGIRQALVWAFNDKAQMIPSTACRVDLRTGEHRNLMALMIFKWENKLYPGPQLLEFDPYRRLWPELTVR